MTSRSEIRARSREAAVAKLSKRPFRLLDKLSRSAGGLSTSQLVNELGELYELSRQLLLNRYGQELARHETSGRVLAVGWTEGDWQRPPSLIWVITPSGHAWLDRCRAAAVAHADECPCPALGSRDADDTTSSPIRLSPRCGSMWNGVGANPYDRRDARGVSRRRILGDLRLTATGDLPPWHWALR
jgi:hypothetical protein